MENASKALLIAAAILIVILLIAFGVSVLNSTDDVADSAGQVGDQITQQAGSAATQTNTLLQGISIPGAE